MLHKSQQQQQQQGAVPATLAAAAEAIEASETGCNYALYEASVCGSCLQNVMLNSSGISGAGITIHRQSIVNWDTLCAAWHAYWFFADSVSAFLARSY